MRRSLSRMLIPASLATVLLCGCMPRIIPIQTARVTQVEFFKQYYTFRDASHAKDVFTRILGSRNMQVLMDHYAFGDAINDLLTQKIVAQGSILFTMSLSPTDMDSFFAQGTGRYLIVRKTTSEILLTGDVQIRSKTFNMTDLDSGELRIASNHSFLRYFAPGEINYLSPATIDFIVKMRTVSQKDRVYSIDYQARHPVMFEGEQIGYLEFEHTTPAYDKLIDLRGLDLVREDYRELLEEAGVGEQP